MRSWAELPTDRVVRLAGETREVPPALAVVTVTGAPSLTLTIGHLLRALEQAMRDIFPAWLPEAHHLGSNQSAAAVAAVRALALAKASKSRHFGPFLAELAVAASTGHVLAVSAFAPETRAAGLAEIIGDRPDAAIVVEVADEFPPEAEPVLVGAVEWIADRVRIGVWMTGRELAASSRIPTVFGPPDGPAQDTTTGIPAHEGLPHPLSSTEKRLEVALAGLSWAAGRVWNQTYQSHPLVNAIRVDLMWRNEKCVVELDGADHRSARKYAADRRRDIDLQLHGYVVLRFTNEQIRDDISTVLVQLEHFVRARRLGISEAQHHVG